MPSDLTPAARAALDNAARAIELEEQQRQRARTGLGHAREARLRLAVYDAWEHRHRHGERDPAKRSDEDRQEDSRRAQAIVELWQRLCTEHTAEHGVRPKAPFILDLSLPDTIRRLRGE